MKFGKIWRTYCWVYIGHNCSCLFNEFCPIIPLWDVIMTSRGMKLRLLVERRKLHGPFDYCCSHQSMASASLCLCRDSRWTFWVHFVMDSWFKCIKLMLSKFLNVGFLPFDCFVYRQNKLSETFFQVWALRRWGGRHTHNHTATVS